MTTDKDRLNQDIDEIFEYSLDIICTIDNERRFVTINKAAQTILGYSTDFLIGKSYVDLVHPDDLDATLAEESRLKSGNHISNFDNRIRTVEGLYVNIEWKSRWSKEKQLFFCIARDITEWKVSQQQAALQQKKIQDSEFFLRELSKIARVGGWDYDLEKDLCRWSRTVYDIYELPYSFTPNTTNSVEFFSPEFRAPLRNAIMNSISTGEPWDLEVQLQTAKGKHIWVRSSGEPIMNEKGEVYMLRGVILDIDRYHHNEVVLKRSIDLLTQQNEQLNNFNHLLSHNLRNHANNISMIHSLIAKDTLDANNAVLFEQLEKVSHNLTNTLNDLSEAIKIKEQRVQPEFLQINEVINEVLHTHEPLIKYHEAEIKVALEVHEILFPKIYLESILVNLISNSLKYKSDATPVIEINTTVHPDSGCTQLIIRDNGRGIDLTRFKDKVFGLYQTFHKHSDSRGVGLFLVKTQIESQGGKIEVESKVGEGTTFKIVFSTQCVVPAYENLHQ